jgi:hypothetical protein
MQAGEGKLARAQTDNQARLSSTFSLGAYAGTPSAPTDKGLGVLEWTGKLIPQGLLVKGVNCLTSRELCEEQSVWLARDAD